MTRGRFWEWDSTETFSLVTWDSSMPFIWRCAGVSQAGAAGVPPISRSRVLALFSRDALVTALFFFSPLHTMVRRMRTLMPFVLGLKLFIGRRPWICAKNLPCRASHQLPDILQRLKTDAQTDEIVCLSTCNRTEVYAQSKNRAVSRDAIAAGASESHAGAVAPLSDAPLLS